MQNSKELIKPIRVIREFIKLESASGIILFTMAVLALILDNSPVRNYYQELLNTKLGLQVGGFALNKELLFWVNDGLMAIFFLLVGLEVKRELIVGELNSFAKASLPAIAAVGGMLFPALIYIAFNHADPVAMRGWAIPTATDIAFSLAILALLGKRVPISMKIFLTALAIFDDIGAIIIIAIFYTATISKLALVAAILLLAILFLMNRFKVKKIFPYIIVGIILWLVVLKSGIHATLTGVALAFTIPLDDPEKPEHSPLRELEHKLHPWVAYFVLPVFGFTNAGVSFAGLPWSDLFSTVPIGIICGLFIGKQVGIFLATWLAVKFGFAKMPSRSSWTGIYGISLICGVGFTMSLFIGGLAFDHLPTDTFAILVRFGVLVGSFISGLMGYLLLRFLAHDRTVVALPNGEQRS